MKIKAALLLILSILLFMACSLRHEYYSLSEIKQAMVEIDRRDLSDEELRKLFDTELKVVTYGIEYPIRWFGESFEPEWFHNDNEVKCKVEVSDKLVINSYIELLSDMKDVELTEIAPTNYIYYNRFDLIKDGRLVFTYALGRDSDRIWINGVHYRIADNDLFRAIMNAFLPQIYPDYTLVD